MTGNLIMFWSALLVCHVGAACLGGYHHGVIAALLSPHLGLLALFVIPPCLIKSTWTQQHPLRYTPFKISTFFAAS
jgi:hypothetical protein